MKILGISYGTLNGGNDTMVKEALMGAQEVGAEVEFINVNTLNIKHCTGCKACVMGLFSGRGNACILKDDMQWLTDKMYDADGLIFSVPIFEKCATGLFHTTMDRFGPRMDRGNLMIAQKIAENGGTPIDPCLLYTSHGCVKSVCYFSYKRIICQKVLKIKFLRAENCNIGYECS